MKNSKKLMALVLAGLMMLALLTACGKETPKDPAEEFEKNFSAQITAVFGEDVQDLNSHIKVAVLNYVGKDGSVALTGDKLEYSEGSVMNRNVLTLVETSADGKTETRTMLFMQDRTKAAEAKAANIFGQDSAMSVQNMKPLTDRLVQSYGTKLTGVGLAFKKLDSGNYAFAVSVRYAK